MDHGGSWIRRNHGCGHPSNLIAFDTEWEKVVGEADSPAGKYRLRVGVALAWRMEKLRVTREHAVRFRVEHDFWQLVEQRLHKRTPLWVFAHNLPPDLTVVGFWRRLRFGELAFTPEQLRWSVPEAERPTSRVRPGFVVDRDPPTVFSLLHCSGCRVIFVDSLNYFTCPLRKLGEWVGLEKGAMPESDAPLVDWAEYCHRDAEILKRSVVKLITWHKENDLGNWGYTASRLSHNAWRHRFMPRMVKTHMLPEVRQLERSGYFGGWCELFKRGKYKGDFYHLDINSLYPAIMWSHQLPYKLADYSNRDGAPTVGPHDVTADMIARVKLDCWQLPGYPVKRDEGSRFATGRFITTLAGPELMRARRRGDIVEVLEWARYDRSVLFSKFVRWFYNRRLEAKWGGDAITEQIAKSLLVSLFGRFGLWDYCWEHLDEIADQPDGSNDMTPTELANWYNYTAPIEGDKLTWITGTHPRSIKLRRIGNQWQVCKRRREHPKAMPAICAFVTAWGREWMRNIVETAGRENVWYVSTDAVFVNDVGRDRLEAVGWIGPEQLGRLKTVATANACEFRNVHLYQFGDRAVVGSHKKQRDSLPDGPVTELQFSGLRQLMYNGQPGLVEIAEITKTFRGTYNRGVVLDDGTVIPERLEEW